LFATQREVRSEIQRRKDQSFLFEMKKDEKTKKLRKGRIQYYGGYAGKRAIMDKTKRKDIKRPAL
jgi:hypothetical protein